MFISIPNLNHQSPAICTANASIYFFGSCIESTLWNWSLALDWPRLKLSTSKGSHANEKEPHQIPSRLSSMQAAQSEMRRTAPSVRQLLQALSPRHRMRLRSSPSAAVVQPRCRSHHDNPSADANQQQRHSRHSTLVVITYQSPVPTDRLSIHPPPPATASLRRPPPRPASLPPMAHLHRGDLHGVPAARRDERLDKADAGLGLRARVRAGLHASVRSSTPMVARP